MQYSIVRSNERELYSLRLDAEYYQPNFLSTEKKLKSKKWDYLENLTKSIRSFGAYSLCNQVEYKEHGIPFLRCKDIKKSLIDFSDVLYIDPEANKLLWKSEVKPLTVLFTMSGTVGNTAIATEEVNYPINSNQDIAKIITNRRLNPYYLCVFFQSTHGNMHTSRLPIGSVQKHIFLWQLEQIIVPLFTDNFQSKIENIFKFALSLNSQSEAAYTQAESILLNELNITNPEPKHKLWFLTNYSDTTQAGRIDAEYFQPKYEEIVNAIKNHPCGWDTLGNLVSIKKCIEVGSNEYLDKGIPFVRVSNLSPFEITKEKYISENLYIELKQHQPSRGEILLSKDATPGIAYYLNENPEKLIPSSGILRLQKNTIKINNEYLTLVLNSILTKAQINRDVGGSVILHWRPDQVKDIVIPILSDETQSKIQRKIIASFNLRKESRHILESIIRAVDIAIEQDEQTSIDWLTQFG